MGICGIGCSLYLIDMFLETNKNPNTIDMIVIYPLCIYLGLRFGVIIGAAYPITFPVIGLYHFLKWKFPQK